MSSLAPIYESAVNMVVQTESKDQDSWRCVCCGRELISEPSGIVCSGCQKLYPLIGGIRVCVSDPLEYLRSELAALARTRRDAQKRKDMLDTAGRRAGLTAASLARHRDVIDAEIARAETFIKLLKPASDLIGTLDTSPHNSSDVRRMGWSLDQLFPYLLRDWTGTAELGAASSVIGAAIANAIPERSNKSLVIAGCGAGGLLTEISSGFRRVVGFDLALPVLAAAQCLLDGERIELKLPRSIHGRGYIRLHNPRPQATSSNIELAAMDAFDTAFADASIDCVITTFMIDLLPDPRRLAAEIHRILCDDGVWINYGPSGPLNALWRFDRSESTAFFEAAGFLVEQTDEHRATYLDLSRDHPSWSYQSHMCYLTSARKMSQIGARSEIASPSVNDISKRIPQHYPGATLIDRQSLEAQQPHTTLLRHERIPGRMESLVIGEDVVRNIALVDGKRTVKEIADLLQQSASTQSTSETIDAFARYFKQGVLRWRDEET